MAIVDLSVRGDQPFSYENDDKQVYVICNGEIYNYENLVKEFELKMKSHSDCEVVLHLYLKVGLDKMINLIDGEFSFCICEIDKNTKEVKLFVLDTENPTVEKEADRLKKLNQPKDISLMRDREEKLPTWIEMDPVSRDFYYYYDPYKVTKTDTKNYEEFQKSLNDDEKKLMAKKRYY